MMFRQCCPFWPILPKKDNQARMLNRQNKNRLQIRILLSQIFLHLFKKKCKNWTSNCDMGTREDKNSSKEGKVGRRSKGAEEGGKRL